MLVHRQQPQQEQQLDPPNTQQRQQQQRVQILTNKIEQLRAQNLPRQEYKRRVNVLKRRLTKARRRLRHIEETSVSLQLLQSEQEKHVADLKRDMRMLPAVEAYRQRYSDLKRKLKRASRLLRQVKREREKIRRAVRLPETSFDGVDLDQPGGPEVVAFMQRVRTTFEHEPQVAREFQVALIHFGVASDVNASRDALIERCQELFTDHDDLLATLIEILNRQVE